MMRTMVYKAGAAIELVRFLALMVASGPLVSGNDAGPLAAGVIGSSNVLVAVALLFLGLNPGRYEPYRPLVIVSKLVALVSFAWLLPGIASLDEPVLGSVPAGLVFVMAGLWDAVVMVFVAFARPAKSPNQIDGPGGTQPEVVEMD